MMTDTFSDPVYYYLVRDKKIGDISSDFKKITDYLLTYVGEIGLKRLEEGSVEISYSQTPLKARLKTNSSDIKSDTVISQQIILTCEKDDNVSVNLLKNVTKTIGYRIYNPQLSSFLVINPSLLDLTTTKVKGNIRKIIEAHDLTPIFQFQNALVFYAKDKSGQIHLINRHLLEYLTENGIKRTYKSKFSTVVSQNIGQFVALFDRGLIPISYYDYVNKPKGILNQSGFNLDKLLNDTVFDFIYFHLKKEKQRFEQSGMQSLNDRLILKKNDSALKAIRSDFKKKKKDFLVLKFPIDISFIEKENKLIPKLTVSVYLDS